MQKIKIKIKKKSDNCWVFGVQVEEMKYEAKLNKEYYEKLTDGKIEPDELVKKSFEFLLEREPKESILREFNLSVIFRYFPEYEKEIKKQVICKFK